MPSVKKEEGKELWLILFHEKMNAQKESFPFSLLSNSYVSCHFFLRQSSISFTISFPYLSKNIASIGSNRKKGETGLKPCFARTLLFKEKKRNFRLCMTFLK
jgi:hypothetical protein